MKTIVAADGQIVTESMIDRWAEALDRDEWPEGEHNVGPVVKGRPPMSPEGSEVISIKVPTAMKRAVAQEAKDKGLSMSDYVRTAIAKSLIKTA